MEMTIPAWFHSRLIPLSIPFNSCLKPFQQTKHYLKAHRITQAKSPSTISCRGWRLEGWLRLIHKARSSTLLIEQELARPEEDKRAGHPCLPYPDYQMHCHQNLVSKSLMEEDATLESNAPNGDGSLSSPSYSEWWSSPKYLWSGAMGRPKEPPIFWLLPPLYLH